MKKEHEKEWAAPHIAAEQFTLTEYVSSCQQGAMYEFDCNAGDPETAYAVWSDGPDGKSGTADDRALTENGRYFYAPCGKTVEAPVSDLFETGYIRQITDTEGAGDGAEVIYGEQQAVIIWIDGDRIHCTGRLNRGSWNVNRS